MTVLVLHPARQVRAARGATAARRPGPPAPAAPRAGATRATRPAPLRLTARGRFVVRGAALLLGVVVTAAAVLAGTRVALADGDARPLGVEYRVVQPGETLWQIAGEVAPGRDRRDTVARIVELNALPTAGLAAGQRIAVPAGP